MKLLVVSQYFYPEQFRINDICYGLAKRGHSVTVLTGLPNYPGGEIYAGYEGKADTKETVDGVCVIRCKLRPRHKGTANLIRNYFSFVHHANRKIAHLDGDFDAVYVYGVSPITMALPAIRYKKKHHVPVIYYCCDLWPESVLGEQNGHRQISRRHPVFVVARWLSSYIYRRTNVICCKCAEFAGYIHRICKIPAEKMVVLYEHAEEDYLKVPVVPEDNGIVDFMFLGNIGKVQNCELIVQATEMIREMPGFLVHFVGEGSELENLKKYVGDRKLEDRILFHPQCDVSEVTEYYRRADVCLLTLSNKTETGLTPPSKLFGYLAAGRPVVAAINGAATTIIREAECGSVCEPDDVKGFAEQMRQMIVGCNRLTALGQNGRDYFLKHFTLSEHLDRLEAIIKKAGEEK